MTDTVEKKVYTDRMAAARAARHPPLGGENMKSFTLRVPEQLRADLHQLARMDGRTTGNYARVLLARHVLSVMPEGRLAKERPMLMEDGRSER